MALMRWMCFDMCARIPVSFFEKADWHDSCSVSSCCKSVSEPFLIFFPKIPQLAVLIYFPIGMAKFCRDLHLRHTMRALLSFFRSLGTVFQPTPCKCTQS